MSKLFSCDYNYVVSLQKEKMVGFDYCEEYLTSISNKILLLQC